MHSLRTTTPQYCFRFNCPHKDGYTPVFGLLSYHINYVDNNLISKWSTGVNSLGRDFSSFNKMPAAVVIGVGSLSFYFGFVHLWLRYVGFLYNLVHDGRSPDTSYKPQ
jgi:hypothetical protein